MRLVLFVVALLSGCGWFTTAPPQEPEPPAQLSSMDRGAGPPSHWLHVPDIAMCSRCIFEVRGGLKKTTGVQRQNIDAQTGLIRVYHDGETRGETLVSVAESFGYSARIVPESEARKIFSKNRKNSPTDRPDDAPSAPTSSEPTPPSDSP
ncbi:MAG: heavy-metal-associated domain-containing protein [Deltaproteobacteria bacterium]|nr:MAG: heavy-metal-associated domain-containing protein [Deltaproteobacteria bacterium]